MSSPSGSTATSTEPGPHGGTGGRVAGLITAIGSAIYLAGLAVPVGGDVYEAIGEDDDAGALALLQDSGTEWDTAIALSAVGIVVAAAGLWLLGRAAARVSGQLRVQRAGTTTAWLGLFSGIGVIGQVWLIVASPQDIVDGLGSAPLVIVGGLTTSVGLLGVFIGLGLALVWLRHLRALGWVLMVLGTITIPTHAFLGPPFSYLLLLIAGVILAIAPVRDNSTA